VFGPRPAFPGGIHPPLPSGRARERPIRQRDFAPLLSLPLPAAAQVAVREGEPVERGALLAHAGDATSVPVFAPASGHIQRIDLRPDRRGGLVRMIQLAPFPGSTQECSGGRVCDVERASAEAIVAAIRDAGIVDGEGRPLHVRLQANGESPRLLLLKAIAGDALLSRHRRVLLDQAEDLILGLRYLLRATGAAQATLAVETPDEDAAQAVIAAAPGDLPLVARILPPRYPQGHAPLLVAAVLGKAVTPDRDPVAQGVLCLDVATVAEVGRLLPLGQPSTDTVLCLDGDALDDPGSFRVPLGTPLRFALQQAGLRFSPPLPLAGEGRGEGTRSSDHSMSAGDMRVCRVLEGGPLRGQALASLDWPITAGLEGFVALIHSETTEAQPCIRCGDCLDVCPVQLNPAEMGLLARKGEWQTLAATHALERCFECGCCAYVCPSRIPLVQLFRSAKASLARVPSAEIAP
jgi:Na+-translocating ferredoxin:NAD+ oxidoreductase subunit C